VRGRNQTVSQRSEPISRNALEHEQCYPSQLLHQEDALRRHRGRKPTLQYELSGGITLLSPAYLLSIKRHSFHKVMPDHYKHGKFFTILLELSLLQSSFLYCYYTLNFKMTKLRKPIYLRYSLGGSRPRQTTKFRRSSNIFKNVIF
jgi:hypothetical protein